MADGLGHSGADLVVHGRLACAGAVAGKEVLVQLVVVLAGVEGVPVGLRILKQIGQHNPSSSRRAFGKARAGSYASQGMGRFPQRTLIFISRLRSAPRRGPAGSS